MISRRVVFEIHQLQAKGFSCRSIARQLQIGRETVAKYLAAPDQVMNRRKAGKRRLRNLPSLIRIVT